MKLFTNYTIRILFIFVFSVWSLQEVKAQTATVSFQETYSYNDTFIAAIYIDGFNTLGSVTMNLQFDDTELEVLEINAGPNIGGSFAHNTIQDTILIGWFTLSPLTAADTFATITLLKKTDFCNSPLNWTGVLQITDDQAQNIPTNFSNSKAFYLKDEKPTLVYPNINDPTVPVNSVFRWNDYNIECESGYRLQVATDSFFTQMIVDTVVTDSVFPVVGLQSLTTNYWRVAKVDELNNEYWSGFRQFFTTTTDTIRNSIPTVITWSDTLHIPVTFINSENIGRFNIDIDYDSTALEYLGFENLMDNPTNVQVVDSMNGRVEVNWQTPNYPTVIPSDTMIVLRFVQSTGCIEPVSFNASSEYYFVGNVTIPSSYTDGQITFVDSVLPNLIAPLNNAVEIFIRPELTWDSVQCSNTYRVQVASDSMFTNLFADSLLTDTTFVPTNLNGDSTYYWRVGRYNILDSLYWTGFWKFTTESVLPITVQAHSLATESDTFFVPITIDSLANAIAFQLHIDYDTNAVSFIGFTDTTTLIADLSISADSGTVKIYWESADSSVATVANILSDTLVQLQFEYLSECETFIEFDTDTSDFYHINDNINIDAAYLDNRSIFLRTEFPTLLSPPDGSNTSIYPDFTWMNMDCVEDFHFEISLDDQFTQVVADSILNDTTLWVTNLQANTQYFWRVAKEDFVGQLYWSDTLAFTTTDLYTSTLELDSILTYNTVAEVALTIDSAFFWNGFQIELNYNNAEINYISATDSLFPNIQITDNNGVLTLNWSDTIWHNVVEDTLIVLRFFDADICKTPVTFSNVSYTYRGGAALTNPITTKDGSIEYLNTNAPILTLPLANETDVFPVVDFIWLSVDCSVEYQLQVSQDANFNTILLDTMLLNAAYDDLLLDHNSTYYWRVGRWDTQMDRYWSDTLMFQTSILPTVQVEASNIITYDDTMRVAVSLDSVIWVESFNLAVTYDNVGFEYTGFSDTLFGMDISEQNGTIIINWAADSSNINHWLNSNADTIVYLHFKTIDGCYTDLAWESSVTNFMYKTPSITINNNNTDGSIEWANDEIPTLVYPPNDTMFMPISFELSWNDVNCTEGFTLQIATDENFDNLVVDEANLIDLNYTVADLEIFTTYYWRVGQTDTEGELYWSETRNFETDLENQNDHWIFPNPTDGFLYIWLDQEAESGADITVYNSIGQLMRYYNVDRLGKRVELNLSDLDRGVYLLQFDDGSNQWVERVIVY